MRSGGPTSSTLPCISKSFSTRSTQSRTTTAKVNLALAFGGGVSADDRAADSLNDIKDRLTDELADQELQTYDQDPSSSAPGSADLANRVQYRLTSVYDYSIFEALSRVIMKLVPQQAALENLMNLLAQQSGIEKCFLVRPPPPSPLLLSATSDTREGGQFDVWSKLYIATDSSPVDAPTLQLCSEFMDLFVDFSDLYGVPAQPSPVSRLSGHPPGSTPHPSTANHRSPSRRRPVDGEVEVDDGRRQKMITSHVRLDTRGTTGGAGGGGKVVSYYQINPHLSLVCITHEDAMDKQGALIEYKSVPFPLPSAGSGLMGGDSVSHLRTSISDILDLTSSRRRRRRRRPSASAPDPS